MSEQTARDLEAAAEAILRRGWHQGGYVGKDGAICSLGGLNLAIYGDVMGCGMGSREQQARLALWRAIGTLPMPSAADGDGIAGWNDTPGRSLEDVLLVFKQAAEAERT